MPLVNDCSADLKFIKPDLDCESFKNAADKMQGLQDNIRRQVNGYLNTKRADRISVFVRDLDSQRFASVNESDEYFMASLLKVPLAVAYYRLAELTPDLLSQKITYTGAPNLYAVQEIKPSKELAAGKTYTVEDLIYRALAYSDNTAAELLSENYVSYDYLQKILLSLGLDPKPESQKENMVTARSYAGILRSLYNASFLSRLYSDKILKTLSESTFADGATANLPKDAVVSHKFGERSIIDDSTGAVVSRQLHDCGIVYGKQSGQTYNFCIMTEGDSFSNLEPIIQTISSTIYKEMVK